MSGFALKVEQERAGLLRLLEAVAEEVQARAGGFAGTLCSKVGGGGSCGMDEGSVVWAWKSDHQNMHIIHLCCVQMEAEAFAQEHLGRVLEEERKASEAVLRIESGGYVCCAGCVCATKLKS